MVAVVEATGPKFYERLPGSDPRQTRKVNSLGKKAADKRTGKLSSLELWEGYRVFRDERSPTGWIDLHRVPIVAIDTNGHALRKNLRTGKTVYVDATPAGAGGGLFGGLGKILPFYGDALGGILELSGHSEANAIRVQTGVAAVATIVSAGGLGATSLAGLTGATSTAGGVSALLGAGSGGFSSLVGSPVGAAGIVPIGAPASRQESTSNGPRLSAVAPMLLWGAGIAAFLILTRKR